MACATPITTPTPPPSPLSNPLACLLHLPCSLPCPSPNRSPPCPSPFSPSYHCLLFSFFSSPPLHQQQCISSVIANDSILHPSPPSYLTVVMSFASYIHAALYYSTFVSADTAHSAETNSRLHTLGSVSARLSCSHNYTSFLTVSSFSYMSICVVFTSKNLHFFFPVGQTPHLLYLSVYHFTICLPFPISYLSFSSLQQSIFLFFNLSLSHPIFLCY